MTYPRLAIDMYIPDAQGSDVLVGTLDCTEKVVEYLANPRNNPDFKSRQLPPVSLGFFMRDMTQAEIDAFRAGNLRAPGFDEKITAFVEACGGYHGVVGLKKRISEIERARFELARAEEILLQVSQASLAPDASGYTMFCPRWVHQDYVSEVSEAYDSWNWDEYTEVNPRPETEFDSPEYVAWQEIYSAWVKANSPPFVFATTETRWSGIDAKDVREAFENDGEVDTAWLLEGGLQEHHEDAETMVVDVEGLDSIVDSWLPHAETGSAEDLSLEAVLETWNAKQTITSYYEDITVVIPVGKDVDKATIIAWAEADLERRCQHLVDLETSWQPEGQGESDPNANASSSFTAG